MTTARDTPRWTIDEDEEFGGPLLRWNDDVIAQTTGEEQDGCMVAYAALVELVRLGTLVSACPPGSRVVVDRTPKPCPECFGETWRDRWGHIGECPTCDGRRVVEATTTYGLEPEVAPEHESAGDPLDVLQPLLNWDRPPAVEKP